MQLALFGDIGGHYAPFAQGLEDLGVDVGSTRVPEGMVVVQVGDLIDRGPQSAQCVDLADRFMRADPNRWIQLFGNHEGNRVGGPRFWDEPLDPDTATTLRRWWQDRAARMALAVRSAADGDLLVTHGGLVAPLWQLLGRPSIAEAVTTLNAWVGREPALAFAAGGLLGGGGIPGPAWPDAGTELYGSWVSAGDAPFGQVHGHSSIGDWSRRAIHRGAPRWLRKAASLDLDRRHERVTIGGRQFIGIDPTLGTETSLRAVSPLLIEGEIIA